MKYIVILLFLSSCDSGCIESTSTGSTTIRSYSISAAPTYYSSDTAQFVISPGFSSTQGVCFDAAESQNPITNSLSDYWFSTGVVYDNVYTYEGSATGAAYFCGAPNNILEKSPIYVFDYQNSKFIVPTLAGQLSASAMSNGASINMWYDSASNITFNTDAYLNRASCAGKTGALYVDLYEGNGGSGASNYDPLIMTAPTPVVRGDTASTVVVPKGCVIDLYEHYGAATDDVTHFAYPTEDEWLDYFIYDLRRPLFTSGDSHCLAMNGEYRAQNCISGVTIRALDPNVEGVPGSGDACTVRLMNNWFVASESSFDMFANASGNTRYVSISVGNSGAVSRDLAPGYHDISDTLFISRNCEADLFVHGSGAPPSFVTLRHPADYESSSHPFYFDPVQYLAYDIRATNNDYEWGGLRGANIADTVGGNDKEDGQDMEDVVTSYSMYQDPDWEGVTGMYPTIDKTNEGVRFDGVDDFTRITASQYSSFLNYFTVTYSTYFYFKPSVKAGGLHTLYATLEGSSIHNQKLGDTLYIDSDDSLYFAYDSDVYLLDDVTNYFDGSAHEILFMRDDSSVVLIVDGDYDNKITVALSPSSSFSNMSNLRSFMLGNIVAWDEATELENVMDADVGFYGYIKDFQIFHGDLKHEEQVDFFMEQEEKWGVFSCDLIGTVESLRIRIGNYISDIPPFDASNQFLLPPLSSFYTYDASNVLTQASSIADVNGQDIYFHVNDPVVDMCTNVSTGEVKKEYSNNLGKMTVLLKRSNSGSFSLIGNLYEVIVSPIENVLGQEFFQVFYDRVVGNCDSGTCTNPLFQRLLFLCLALYVTLTGISLLFGLEQISKFELMRRIILIGVIYTLFSPSSWEFFNLYIIYFFQNGAMDAAQLISNSVFGLNGSYSSFVNGEIVTSQDFSGIFEPLEYISELIISEQLNMKILSLLFSPPFVGLLMILMIYYSFYVFFCIAFNVLIAYATILVIMAVGIVMAPFFFLFLLFKLTTSFFDKWISLMIASSLQLIVLSATVTFFSWIVYSLLITGFNYAVCWGVIWTCCNGVPGVDFSLLEFYVPGGYEMMLGRFGYENVVSSAPEFETIAILLVFMLTFDAFIEFSLKLGKKIAGGGGMSVGAMMKGASKGFSDTLNGMKEGAEWAADEASGGKYSNIKRDVKQSIHNNTMGKLDAAMGLKANDKKASIDATKGAIEKAKKDLVTSGVTDPVKKKEEIAKAVRSALEKRGMSEKDINKVLKSSSVKRDSEAKLSRGDAKDMLKNAMQQDKEGGSARVDAKRAELEKANEDKADGDKMSAEEITEASEKERTAKTDDLLNNLGKEARADADAGAAKSWTNMGVRRAESKARSAMENIASEHGKLKNREASNAKADAAANRGGFGISDAVNRAVSHAGSSASAVKRKVGNVAKGVKKGKRKKNKAEAESYKKLKDSFKE